MYDGEKIKEVVRDFFSREGIKVESISNERAEFLYKIKFMRFVFTVVRPNDQPHIQVESQVLISPQHLKVLTPEKMRKFQIESMRYSFTQEVLLGFVQPRPGQQGPQPPGPGFIVSQRIYDDAFSEDRLWNVIRAVHNVVDMVIHILNDVTGQPTGKPSEEPESGLSYYT
jgi:hypothetical protein